ncbi:hypothetical protein [Mycobacterium simiae]|uniref:hypothetical protein n=1 Tax=Mycobacterium simiae TaxID=1784 RepID=UPI0021CD760B|nr:hypothetical protein [Mycobacterium simiae]
MQYLATLCFELLCLARARGTSHAALVPLNAIELLEPDDKPHWALPSPSDIKAISALLANAT